MEEIKAVIKGLGHKTHHNTINGKVLYSVFLLSLDQLTAKARGNQIEITWGREPALSSYSEGITIVHDRELWHLARGKLQRLYKLFGDDLYGNSDWRSQLLKKEET